MFVSGLDTAYTPSSIGALVFKEPLIKLSFQAERSGDPESSA